MRWGEMKTQSGSEAVGLRFAKRFDQRMVGVGVEIIQYDINAVSARIQDIDQIAQGIGEITFGALTGDGGLAVPRFKFSKHEQVPSAIALIFMVFQTGVSRTDWNGNTGLFEQLDTLLIETN